MKQPIVSVLLPVYNGATYLKQAIQSILDQTFTNFELIIINDGSKDNSAEIVKSFDDPRIRYEEQKNAGLAETLNRAIELSSGRYLARQDQDDAALPDRLAKQVAFLDTHPDYGLVGTWATIRTEDELTKRLHRHPSDNGTLQFALLFDNPFVHSSLMIRKEALEKIGHYTTDPKRQPPEDYELWSRLTRSYCVANLPQALQVYRETGGSMSRTGIDPFTEKVIDRSVENMTNWLPDADERAIRQLATLVHYRLTEEPVLSLKTFEDLLFALYNKASQLPDTNQVNLRRQYRTILHVVRLNYPSNSLIRCGHLMLWALSRIGARLGLGAMR